MGNEWNIGQKKNSLKKEKEFAVIVGLIVPGTTAEQNSEYLDELEFLALTAGAVAKKRFVQKLSHPDKRYFVGKGKMEEIREYVELNEDVNMVIFDDDLTGKQVSVLEEEMKVKIIDRSTLILDIFANRAQTAQSKTQVELAQMQYMLPRLRGLWTHLERQKGGIGLRGPGEKQLETDRRLINVRIQQIKKRLDRVDSRREQGRRNRKKKELPTVSVVGYTNAGKSTLFNRLTDSDVYSADQLFATLDPTIRKLELGSGGDAVIADTVGFVSNLPHELVESFRSTLQETREATVLLHIIDAADPLREARRDQVQEVLTEIGADVPQILVLNKIDLLDQGQRRELLDEFLGEDVVAVSAVSGEGIDALLERIAKRVQPERRIGWLTLSAGQGRERAMLYDRDAVKQEQIGTSGEFILQLEIAEHDWRRFLKQTGIDSELVMHPV